jgi:hypothetical protein
MIVSRRPFPTPVSSAVAPSREGAPLTLARVFIWESTKIASALTRYLERVGHPFVARGADSLPAPLRGRKRGGRVFELFVLPIDLSALVATAQRAEARREIKMIFDLSDLPVLMVIRKKRPVNPLHPERELRGILDHLPTWRPDGQAEPVPPSQTTTACSHSRPPLRSAPVMPRADGDDKTLAVFGSQT